MTHTLIDIYNHILKYDDKEVYIAIHSKTSEPYFNAKQVCEMLNYEDYHQAIREHILKEDIFYLKDIVINYKTLYKNVQGHSKFLNEGALYTLILKSKKPNAKQIFVWITHEVMPALRKYGQYKMNSDIQTQINELNKQIKKITDENKVLKHNQQKPKIKKGGMIYIIRNVENKVDFEVDEKIYLKFGKSNGFKFRKSTYETGQYNRIQILKSILVKNPKNIERCVITKMEDNVYIHGKEFFECSYKQLIDIVAQCIKFFENKKINKKLEIQKISRENISNFNNKKNLQVSILTDDEFDELIKKINTQMGGADIDTDTDEILSSDESDTYDSDNYNIQDDDSKVFYMKYIQSKLKYLELKNDLSSHLL
jgi:prophage antirepressor-like protein